VITSSSFFYNQVGVTGYCMGGALSIASGVLVPEVDAVVAFYGTPSSELADPFKAKAPIQAHFGEHDNFVGFSDVTVRLSFTRYLSLLLW
jgi:carboxymethylenebutenolidase